jgi:tetratricopeptide (TPR) repeat protein
MRCLRPIALLFALSVPALPALAQPRADVQARLERERAANPGSVAANRALGIWYYRAGRFAEARAPLEQARQLDPKDGVSALYAGLAAEQMKDLTAARSAYNRYLEVGKTRSAQTEIRARLVAISREELKLSAKAAVANERTIAQQPGSPRTVAVLPMRFTGTDQSLAPLERGLADLMVSDLAKAKALTVLERDRMQSIVDEIALGRSGQADPSTAARAGKLIQAGRIVQGAITQTGSRNLTLNAAVLNTSTSETQGQPAQQGGDLDQLFNLEKALVFQVFDALGVTLTPAERQLVDQRPTRSLQAFLAYSRGLQAEDDGRLDEAARFFDNARSIDPGFGAALQRAQSAAAAATSSPAKVETSLRSSAEGQIVNAAERGSTTTQNTALANTLNSAVGDVNPTTTNSVASGTTSGTGQQTAPQQRAASSEATGTNNPAPRTGQVTIIIRKP